MHKRQWQNSHVSTNKAVSKVMGKEINPLLCGASYRVHWSTKPQPGGEGLINMNNESGFLLYSTYFAWKRKIESALSTHDLTHVQLILLTSLGFLTKDGRDVSQNDLAKFLSFDVTMTSQVLRSLEKRGLLSRSQKEGDERSKFPKLTEAGMQKIQIAVRDLLKAENSFFLCLGDNKQTFDDLLRGILHS